MQRMTILIFVAVLALAFLSVGEWWSFAEQQKSFENSFSKIWFNVKREVIENFQQRTMIWKATISSNFVRLIELDSLVSNRNFVRFSSSSWRIDFPTQKSKVKTKRQSDRAEFVFSRWFEPISEPIVTKFDAPSTVVSTAIGKIDLNQTTDDLCRSKISNKKFQNFKSLFFILFSLSVS